MCGIIGRMAKRALGSGAWVAIGATAGAMGGVLWAYVGSGPDRYEWIDIAIVMGPVGLLLGALAGVVAGGVRR